MEVETIQGVAAISGTGCQQRQPSRSISLSFHGEHVCLSRDWTGSHSWSWLYSQCHAQSVSEEFSTPLERYMEKLPSAVKTHGVSSSRTCFHVIPQRPCSYMAWEVLHGLFCKCLPSKGWLLPLCRWSTQILQLPRHRVAAPRQMQHWELRC